MTTNNKQTNTDAGKIEIYLKGWRDARALGLDGLARAWARLVLGL